jgi:hypothetical protein
MTDEHTPMTRAQLDEQVGQAVHAFLASGGRPEDVRDVLEHHAEGAEYVQETVQRLARQQQNIQSDNSDTSIEEDSVETVE